MPTDDSDKPADPSTAEASPDAGTDGREEDNELSAYWNDLRREGGPEIPERRFAREHPGDLIIGTSKERMLVRIHPDGQLTYGPEYTPDEAAVTFWEEMGRRRLESEARIIQIMATERLLARIGQADLAYERAQRRAQTDTASEHDRFMEEMSRRSLEARVHELVEFARGIYLGRPDLQEQVRTPIFEPPPAAEPELDPDMMPDEDDDSRPVN
jgi:hypothetical protein